jgi:hypothetical protein
LSVYYCSRASPPRVEYVQKQAKKNYKAKQLKECEKEEIKQKKEK